MGEIPYLFIVNQLPYRVLDDITLSQMDMVNHGAIKISLRRLFATLGSFFCVISTILSLVYFFTARERVPQKSDTPGIRQGLTAVWRNKPMRLLLFCDLLNVVTIGTDQENYFIDVLGYASLSTITQIPAVPLSLTSYS